MNHAEVRSRMAEYLEGELELSKRALFDGHLDACQRCSREFLQLRETIRLLRALPDPEPPQQLAEDVMRRIRNGEARLTLADRWRAGMSLLATPRVALPATAVAVGLMLATGSLGTGQLSINGIEGLTFLRNVLQQGAELPSSGAQQAGADRPNGTNGTNGMNGESPVARTRSDVAEGATRARTDSRVAAVQGSVHIYRSPGLPTAPSVPAVARLPRITIQIPGADANGNLHRVATRWPARSARGPATFASGSAPGVRPGGNGLMQAGGAEASSARSPATYRSERERSKRAELDARLDRMIRHPARFAAEFAGLSTAEQEIWLGALAEHALELDRGREAIRELRLASDSRALELATGFSAELRRTQARKRAELASVAEER